MKKIVIKILPFVLLLAYATGCTSVITSDKTYSDYDIKFSAKQNELKKIAQNGDLELFVNASNVNIALSYKSTKWESYPFFNTEDTKNSQGVYSPFVLKGYDISGREFEMDSYVDCIFKNQFEVTTIDNGFEIKMTIGKIEKERLLPMVVRAEVFDSILAQVKTERGKTRLPFLYKKYSLNDEKADEAIKKEWLDLYPSLASYDLYVLKPDVTDREKDELEKYIKESDYTLEKLAQENKLLDYKGKSSNKPVVTLVANFTLDKGDLKVSIPIESIKYDTESFILNRIDFLPSLSSTLGDNGKYMFVPDGCGAVIDLKSTEKKISGKITLPIYGNKIYRDISYGEQITRLPVFGIGKENSAMLAIIEQGEGVASVNVDYGSSKIKTIYPTFIYKDYYSENASDVNATGTKWSKVEKSLPVGNYTVRYKVLTGANNNYTDMANAYREYLKGNDILKTSTTKIAPLFIETLGSIGNGNKNISLTTFDQDIEILNDFKNSNITDIILKLKGWCNSGYENTIFNKIKFMDTVGDKNKFSNLVEFTQTSNIKLFPSVDFMTVSKAGIFSGFYPNNDAARANNEKYAGVTLKNAANGNDVEGSFAYLVKPALLKDEINKFIDSADRIYSGGFSLENMGSLLYGDYSSNTRTNRVVSQSIVEESLSSLSKNREIMLDGGNLYSLKYSNYILNVPTENSNFQDYDSRVPFFQMVFHGYKNFAGQAINLASDPEEAFLRSIETGSSLYFVFAYNNSNEIKSTAYSNLFSVDYGFWKNKSMKMFTEIKDIMNDINDAEITNHQKIQENAYATTFGDIKTIIVNYNDFSIEYNNNTIIAKSYLVMEGRLDKDE